MDNGDTGLDGLEDWKWCSGCQDSKPKSAFYKDKHQKDGVSTNCKECYKRLREKKITSGKYNIKIRKDPRKMMGFEEQGENIKRIVTLLYENPKLTALEIASQVGLTPGTVDTYMRSNNFLKSLRVVGSAAITRMIPNAVQSLKESLNAQSEDVKLKASVKILESEKVLGPGRMDVTVNDLSNKTHAELVTILENLKSTPLPPVIEAEVIE